MIKCENACPLGQFEGCCYCCSKFNFCKDACSEEPEECGEATFDEETGLQSFRNSQIGILHDIVNLINQKKKIDAYEKELKDKLKKAMEQYGIKKFSSDVLEITYVPDGIRTTINGAKLKKLHPEIAEECSKVSKTSAYVKVTVKGGDK